MSAGAVLLTPWIRSSSVLAEVASFTPMPYDRLPPVPCPHDPPKLARWEDSGHSGGVRSAHQFLREGGTDVVLLAWVIALLTGFYMLPWAVAVTRSMPNTGSILLINLLLGWTIVGWIVALVMACSQPRQG
jgi:hypothetical protein